MLKAQWNAGYTGLHAQLEATKPGKTALLVVTDPCCKEAQVSLPGAEISSRSPGQWEILMDLPDAPTCPLSIT